MYLSACYKQAVLQEDTGVFVLTTYVTVCLVVWGFAFTPLNALPGMGGTPLGAVGDEITGGIKCLSGVGEAGCKNVLWPWVIFIFSFFFMNVLMLGITKFGSAT